MWYVEIKKKGRHGVQRLELDDRPVTIGRESTNKLVLHDTGVSRQHCVIESTDGAWHIRDLGSRHGMYINGERSEEACLVKGDHIRIGSYQLTLVSGDPSDQPPVNGSISQQPRVNSSNNGQMKDDSHQTARIVEVQKDAALPAATRDELGELQDTVSALEQGFESRLSALEKQLQQSQAMNTQLQIQIEENAALFANQAARLERIESEHGDLKGRVDETQANLAAETDKLHQALTTMQRLSDELEPTSTQVAELTTRLDETINSWFLACEQAGAAQDRCDELSKRLSNIEQDKDAHRVESAKLESKLDEVRLACENAEQSASEAKQEQEITRERLEELHILAQKAVVEAQEAKSQTEAAQAQLATIESRYQALVTMSEAADKEKITSGISHTHQNAPKAETQHPYSQRVPSLLDSFKGSTREYREYRDYGVWLVSIALTLIGITAIVLTIIFTR